MSGVHEDPPAECKGVLDSHADEEHLVEVLREGLWMFPQDNGTFEHNQSCGGLQAATTHHGRQRSVGLDSSRASQISQIGLQKMICRDYRMSTTLQMHGACHSKG